MRFWFSLLFIAAVASASFGQSWLDSINLDLASQPIVSATPAGAPGGSNDSASPHVYSFPEDAIAGEWYSVGIEWWQYDGEDWQLRGFVSRQDDVADLKTINRLWTGPTNTPPVKNGRWRLTYLATDGSEAQAIAGWRDGAWRFLEWTKTEKLVGGKPKKKPAKEKPAFITVLNTARQSGQGQWTYPTRRGWTRKKSLIAHLMGEIGATFHAGKFTRNQLQSLTLQQLESLHSNDHEGKPFLRQQVAHRADRSEPVRWSVVIPAPSAGDFYCPPGST